MERVGRSSAVRGTVGARSARDATGGGISIARDARSYRSGREGFDQLLGLLALAVVAFLQHFLEDAARAFRVAHVDVRPRE